MDWVDTAPIVTLVADNVIIARDERISSPVYELIGIYSLKQDGDPRRGLSVIVGPGSRPSVGPIGDVGPQGQHDRPLARCL